MAGVKGKITRAPTGKKAVYLSDVFGVWPEGRGFHLTMLKGEQEFHTYVVPEDGLLHDVISMMYHYGQAQ